MAKDYADIFLKAMKTISDAAVSQLSFDKTIICHIIDNSKGKSILNVLNKILSILIYFSLTNLPNCLNVGKTKRKNSFWLNENSKNVYLYF